MKKLFTAVALSTALASTLSASGSLSNYVNGLKALLGILAVIMNYL